MIRKLELSEGRRTTRAIRYWVALALTVAGLGAGTMAYLNRYAEAADLEKVADTLRTHMLEETSRMSAVETQGKNIEEDYHWQREQLQRIADKIGADQVEPPKH